MKKWGWHGQDRSHGVSLAHRSMGSSGGGQGSGSRVHPGKKMAGRMGGQRHTTQNLKVLQVDDANGIVIVHGTLILHVTCRDSSANKPFCRRRQRSEGMLGPDTRRTQEAVARYARGASERSSSCRAHARGGAIKTLLSPSCTNTCNIRPRRCSNPYSVSLSTMK